MDEKIDCVMLAAGASSRMGSWKLTLPLRNSTVIECSVNGALKVCSRVILVSGFRAEELERLFCDWKNVTLVVNDQYTKGMFSSIKTGVTRVHTDRFFVALGDMPLVDPAVYERLVQFRNVPVIIPKYKGKKGHPILLAKKVIKAITALDETRTLRDVLAQFPTLAVPVENSHILHDIDSQEDYENLIGHHT
jgi:molybdenum cofactor cytidylyltransferase